MNKLSCQVKQSLSLLPLSFLMLGTSCGGSVPLDHHLMTNVTISFFCRRVRSIVAPCASQPLHFGNYLHSCSHMPSLASLSATGDSVSSKAVAGEDLHYPHQALEKTGISFFLFSFHPARGKGLSVIPAQAWDGNANAAWVWVLLQ